MSTAQQFTDGVPSIPAQELNIANVTRDYHNHRTTTYHNHAITTINSDSGSRALDRLLGRVAHGALHDSAERGPDAPKCHPETRTAVQSDIMSWIRHGEQDDAPKRILWLSGPAGSGKTAIAGTIADECYKQGLLAASFFFSAFAGSKNRRWKKPVIPTLVYRLIQHKSIIGLKEEVLAVIDDDPGVFERHLDQQLEELVLKPLRKVAGRSNPRDWPAIILLDGLDECQGDSELDVRTGGDTQAPGSSAQKDILSALSRACTDPAFPFRIIIASRPEPTIRHFFSTSPGLSLDIFLDDKYDPDSDIRLFLEAMFNDIRRRFNLPSTWASKDVVDILVEEASGQFIYAATVIRFINSPSLGSAQQQLVRVLEWRRLNNSKPFATLDALYSRILHTSPEPRLAVKWLCIINEHRDLMIIGHEGTYIKDILESYSGETEHVLGNLVSLVRLVDEHGIPEFHFYHKSLLDFLEDPHRSSDLHINEESLIHFEQNRYYQVLRARGPQSNADPSTNPPSPDFLRRFCGLLWVYIDPHRRYTSGDVEWWLTNLHELSQKVQIPAVFASIHWQCKWYRCLPACGVWRKGILQHCRQHGWRLLTTMEMLRDRFKKFQFDWRSPQEFPLRALVVESES